MLNSPLAVALGSALAAVVPTFPTMPAYAASAPAHGAGTLQRLSCVTDTQRNGTIYIHNGCEQQIYWLACVRSQDSQVSHPYEATGIAPGGDYDFSPANDPAPFTYYILSAFQPSDFRC